MAVIILSQSILLLLFSDVIQKKSPRISAVDQASINTPLTRIPSSGMGRIGNVSIRGDWLAKRHGSSGVVGGRGAGVLFMKSNNDTTPLLQFDDTKQTSAFASK